MSIIIVEDRYSGTYSDGLWIAIADYYRDNRLDEVESLANGDDVSSRNFWHTPPTWVAVGNTPNEALAKLINYKKELNND